MPKNERAIKAGEAFARIVEENPESWEKFSLKLAVFGHGLQELNKIREELERNPSRKMVDARAEFAKAQADLEVERDRFDKEWEAQFGEPPPKSIEDLQRWGARVGWDGERISCLDWGPNDLYPIIEGYLQRLADQASVTQNPPGDASTPPEQASLDSRASAMLLEHPDWTNAQISDAIGCPRTSLCTKRTPNFMAARQMQRATLFDSVPKGRKCEGVLEAWNDDE